MTRFYPTWRCIDEGEDYRIVARLEMDGLLYSITAPVPKLYLRHTRDKQLAVGREVRRLTEHLRNVWSIGELTR